MFPSLPQAPLAAEEKFRVRSYVDQSRRPCTISDAIIIQIRGPGKRRLFSLKHLFGIKAVGEYFKIYFTFF